MSAPAVSPDASPPQPTSPPHSGPPPADLRSPPPAPAATPSSHPVAKAPPPASPPHTAPTPPAAAPIVAKAPPPASPLPSATAPPAASPPVAKVPPSASPPLTTPTPPAAGSPVEASPPPPTAATPPAAAPPVEASPSPPTQIPKSPSQGPTPPNSPPLLRSPPPPLQTTPIARHSPSPPYNPPPGSGSTGSGNGGGISSTVIVGVAIGGGVLLAILAVFIVYLRRRKSKGRRPPAESEHTSSQHKAGGYDQAGRRPRFESPSSSSEISGKPTHPPSQRLPPHLPRQSLDAHVQPQAHLFAPKNFQSPSPLPKLSDKPPNLGISNSSFTYAELEQATNGFSRVNLLGEGGFGFVFKGFLPDGRLVAVKQLKIGGGQGEREFQAEVEIISRVHHRHLVSLVGYCIAGSQRLLVYEFVPNGTLEQHLHGKGNPVMDWTTRVQIAIGAARGLAYLHEDCHPRIIHRDIKSSNILLDFQFEAKVSDFGLAKLASDTNTHVTTRVMGTFGYLAPEYASSGKLTEKSDVYSFGVVLLELLTGRKPVESFGLMGDESLVEWVRPLLRKALEDGTVEGLLEPRLETNYSEKEVMRMIAAAAACVRHSAHKRPRLAQVVRALEGDAADLNQGKRPGLSSKYDLPCESVEYDSAQYDSDLERFRKMAFDGNQEYGSEYSGSTSDYGANPSSSSYENQAPRQRC